MNTVRTAVAAAAAASALLAAGCGSSSDTNGVAQLGSTPTTTSGPNADGSRSAGGGQDLVAFTACMRKHGVPNLPDPKADSNGYHLRYGPENGIDVKSARFKNAQQTCNKLLPNGGTPSPQAQAAQLKEALTFAACIRSHGVPNFPDPKLSSNGNLAMGPSSKSSVDPNSPRFKIAQKACEHLRAGAGGDTSTTRSGEAP
jgi:hypothetical protein